MQLIQKIWAYIDNNYLWRRISKNYITIPPIGKRYVAITNKSFGIKTKNYFYYIIYGKSNGNDLILDLSNNKKYKLIKKIGPIHKILKIQ